ncbi:DUF4440 domain-containing protein [Halobacillus locisalis]|uniref:DUF4440 domain-containing protein n=1 Tax=Halobacillus locisalis TaxID=220753 RepID=A0A838CNQ9_9BACI|nr:DUF4440 domain-containing protein [Halobacillus locisalis]MBA2173687.1 DUF4440 domain-containing protein [Halobacillus locisalis]
MNQQLIQQLKVLEKSHISLEVRTSKEAMNEILADEFWEIGSSGIIYDKEYCLEQGVVLTDMSLHHYHVQELSEGVALATYLVVDKTRQRNTWRSSIWKFIDDRWQLYFHQGTITKDSPELESLNGRSDVGLRSFSSNEK